MTRILLVDDDEDIHEIISVMLGDFEIVSAHNGREAINAYGFMKKQGMPPDLVLQDLGLPDMDGVMVTQEIMRIDPSANICILSGSDQDKMGGALRAGASDFLPKPFRFDQLREKIGLMCQKALA